MGEQKLANKNYDKMSQEHLKELHDSEERTRIAFHELTDDPEKYSGKALEQIYQTETLHNKDGSISDLTALLKQLEKCIFQNRALQEKVNELDERLEYMEDCHEYPISVERLKNELKNELKNGK